MTELFGDGFLDRPPREVAPGAVHIPGWLSLSEQNWIIGQFRLWAAGPVPMHRTSVHGHEMSVATVGLGWHWQPSGYSRNATDVNGNRVLDFPDWMARLGRRAVLEATGDERAGAAYQPDTALVNFYDDTAKMGMHQDKDERSLAPVVSLSIGNRSLFRFGNTLTRNRPYDDLTLESGDLFVFGGASRRAFHGIMRVYPGTAPEGCELSRGRINITMRETGLGR